ncbi:MAG: hypothetical protein MJ070_01590 [Lachnospiraceae bacterium]|nr:hypothetical protein [Lachnospiraceae bacterium]
MGTKQASMGVYIALGPYNAHGDLICGNRLTMDEINDVINGVLKEYGITAEQIVEAQRIIQKAEDTFKLPIRSGADAILALIPGAGEGAVLADFMEVITGDKRPTATQLAGCIMGAFTMVAVILAGAKGFTAAAFTGIVSLFGAIIGNTLDYVSEEGIIQIGQAIKIAVALQFLYDDINKKLEELIESNDRKCQIVFDGAATEYPVSFMGVPGNTMYVCAKGVLTKTETVDYDKYRAASGKNRMDIFNGTYKGDLDIEIWFNMDAFDSAFKDKVFLGGEMPFGKLPKICNSIKDTYTRTGIKKTLHLSGYTVDVSPRTHDVITLDLGKFANNDMVKIDHKVKVVPNKVLTTHDDEGIFKFPNGEFAASIEYGFGGAVDSGKYVDLILADAFMTNSSHETVPYLGEIVFDQSKDFGNQGTMLMDSELYYFLNKPAYLCFVTNTFKMD